MPKRRQKTQESKTNLQDLVTVTFTRDISQAKDYETLLKINDIPTIIKKQSDNDKDKGIAIMVPEDFLDEAHVIIESQDSYDDFYDSALEDELDDLDTDLLDNDF